MHSFTILSTLVALAASANAASGVPSYIGELLLQPGLSAEKCMTAASNTNGAAVTIQPCTGAPAQKWTFTGGSVKIFGDKCLDVPNGKTANGVNLQIWTCGVNNPNQQFDYTWDNHLGWTNHNICVDLTGGSLANGNHIHTWQCYYGNANQVWNAGYLYNALPVKSENGQSGTNACGTTSSQTSQCQTAWLNDVDDFCLWGPPTPGSTIGNSERVEVAWCSKSGRGTRTFPPGTLKGVHFVRTPDYVQVTGQGDFTKINIQKNDEGGELDPHGADGNGNPIGGLVFGNTFGPNLQYHEWTSFMSDTEFCFRACTGPNAAENCQHIYDVMGCYWNMPANYDAGVFESCKGNNDLPMGVYGTSTWHQGTSPTPPPHPVAASSQCTTLPTVTVTPHRRKRDGFVKVVVEPTSTATAD